MICWKDLFQRFSTATDSFALAAIMWGSGFARVRVESQAKQIWKGLGAWCFWLAKIRTCTSLLDSNFDAFDWSAIPVLIVGIWLGLSESWDFLPPRKCLEQMQELLVGSHGVPSTFICLIAKIHFLLWLSFLAGNLF